MGEKKFDESYRSLITFSMITYYTLVCLLFKRTSCYYLCVTKPLSRETAKLGAKFTDNTIEARGFNPPSQSTLSVRIPSPTPTSDISLSRTIINRSLVFLKVTVKSIELLV